MFWGVTLETGKRYAQVVDSSYHLSMAALEPLPSVESGKFVSVMIEHNKSEFLLCTMEHNRVLQVTLDHCFVEGEEVTYYLSGEGTVHLTGYIITDGVDGGDESDESEDVKHRGLTSSTLTKVSKDSIKHELDSEDDDEEDEDWKPGLKKQKNLPVLNNNVPAMPKPSAITTNPATKKEKAKLVVEKQQQKSSEVKKFQLKGSFGRNATPAKQSSDEDEEDDDDDDNDFLMGDVNVQEEEDEEDSGEESDEEDNSDWESAEEDEDEVMESPNQPAKKIKVEEETPKAKKVKVEVETPKAKMASGTPTTTKNPHVSTPAPTGGKNQENQSSKKKQKKKQLDGSPQSKTANQKNSNDISRSSSDSTPQSGNKARKSIGGVEILDIVQGNGPAAKTGKMVHVYYRGTFPDKREFDSVSRGKAFSFRLGRSEVIKGWDVGIQGMKVGGKRKLVVPPSMGYGNKASGPIPPNSTLHFEIELKAVS